MTWQPRGGRTLPGNIQIIREETSRPPERASGNKLFSKGNFVIQFLEGVECIFIILLLTGNYLFQLCVIQSHPFILFYFLKNLTQNILFVLKVTDCLTTVKSINKTDAMTLLSTFSVRSLSRCSLNVDFCP